MDGFIRCQNCVEGGGPDGGWMCDSARYVSRMALRQISLEDLGVRIEAADSLAEHIVRDLGCAYSRAEVLDQLELD